MKAVVFLFIAALAARQASAQTQTLPVSALVGSLCPDIQKALGKFTFVTAAAQAIINETVVLPTDKELVLFLPVDLAFAAVFANLGTDAATVAMDPNAVATLSKELVGMHVSTADSLTAQTATALGGASIAFLEGGKPATLTALAAAAKNGTASLKQATQTAKVTSVISCAKERQTAFVLDTVLVEAKYGAGGPAPAPAARAPTPAAPAPTPAGPASSAPAASALGAAVALAAAVAALA